MDNMVMDTVHKDLKNHDKNDEILLSDCKGSDHIFFHDHVELEVIKLFSNQNIIQTQFIFFNKNGTIKNER